MIKVKGLGKEREHPSPKLCIVRGKLVQEPGAFDIIFPVGCMSLPSPEEMACFVIAESFNKSPWQNNTLNLLLPTRAVTVEEWYLSKWEFSFQ